MLKNDKNCEVDIVVDEFRKGTKYIDVWFDGNLMPIYRSTKNKNVWVDEYSNIICDYTKEKQNENS